MERRGLGPPGKSNVRLLRFEQMRCKFAGRGGLNQLHADQDGTGFSCGRQATPARRPSRDDLMLEPDKRERVVHGSRSFEASGVKLSPHRYKADSSFLEGDHEGRDSDLRTPLTFHRVDDHMIDLASLGFGK